MKDLHVNLSATIDTKQLRDALQKAEEVTNAAQVLQHHITAFVESLEALSDQNPIRLAK